MLSLKTYLQHSILYLGGCILLLGLFGACTTDPGWAFVNEINSGEPQIAAGDTARLQNEQLSDPERVTILLRLAHAHQNRDETLALAYVVESDTIAVKNNWRIARAISRYYISMLGGRQDMLGEGIEEPLMDARFCRSIFHSSKLPAWEARTMINLANFHFKQQDFDSAQYYLDHALLLIEAKPLAESEKQQLEGEILHEQAILYSSTEPEQTLSTYDKSARLYRLTGNIAGLARIQLDKGLFYLNQKKYQQADSIYHLTLNYADSTGDINGKVRSYEKLGFLRMDQYRVLKEVAFFEQAMQYYQLCLDLGVENRYRIHNRIGNLFQLHAGRAGGIGDIDSALVYYKLAMEESREEGALRVMKSMGTNISNLCGFLRDSFDRDCSEVLGESSATFFNTNYIGIVDTIRGNLTTANHQIRKLERLDMKQTASAQLMNTIFISAAILVVAVLLFLLLLQRTERKKLEARMEALRAQINPHFMSNSLNAIESLVNQNKREAASKYLIHFSRLTRRILNGSREANTRLSDELETLEHFLALEQLRFRDKLHYRIDVSEEVNPKMVEIPSMILQPYVENAIWHGIKPKKGPGMLRIEIGREGKQLLCIIEDDGIGREKAREQQAVSIMKRKSLGMKITEERIQSSGKIKGTRLEILDLKDPEGTALGTRVIIRLPLKRKKEKQV